MATHLGTAVLVVDDQEQRRAVLIDRLVDQGLTPVTAKTPLDTIGMLTRDEIGLCVMMEGADLEPLLADEFPWIATSTITDDMDATVSGAMARMTDSIGDAIS
jgi:DNA-binding NtrC family response regulator